MATHDHESLATTLGIAAALQETGQLEAARTAFAAVAATARESRNADVFAAAAIGLGGVWVHEQRTSISRAYMLELQREALAVVDLASPLACRLRARLAAEDGYVSGDPSEALDALDDARRSGDPVALADALSLAHHCLLGPDHGGARLALADELIATSVTTNRNVDALIGLTWRTVDLFLAGHPRAERFLRELRSRLDVTPFACVEYVARALEVMTCLRAGRLAEAEALAEACYQLGVEVGDADALGWYGAQLVAIRWLQGRGAELLPVLDELVHDPTMAASNDAFLAGVASLNAWAGNIDEAGAALERIRARGLEATRNSSTWLVTMLAVIEAAHVLGDATIAREAYELLAPFAELPIMASLAIACFGSAHRPLGLAALTFGELDAAIDHLDAAVRVELRLGNRPCHAMSCSLLAAALEMRRAIGDHEHAAALRHRAVAAAQCMGLALPSISAATIAHHDLTIACRRVGRRWQITAGDRMAHVQHSVGMAYLARLVGSPGTEMLASDLAGAVGAEHSSFQPALDERAKAAYRQRITELRGEIDDAEGACDIERAAEARLELEHFLHELAQATGLGGRDRAFRDNTERARTSVQKAIKRALAGIIEADVVIGQALARRVVTGVRCVYE
jgi:tetratricopeptide (TPR) repeat protein